MNIRLYQEQLNVKVNALRDNIPLKLDNHHPILVNLAKLVHIRKNQELIVVKVDVLLGNIQPKLDNFQVIRVNLAKQERTMVKLVDRRANLVQQVRIMTKLEEHPVKIVLRDGIIQDQVLLCVKTIKIH